MKKFYVTTAIDYVNAKPHIGHAFEKIIADALVRWKKLSGKETWFLTGTDDNAQKNEKAARSAGVQTKKFVDKNANFFIELCNRLEIGYDRFIRTTDEDHIKKSREIFKRAYDKGDIYRGKYEGLYCEGCEEFKTEKDLIDGKCPEHGIRPKLISEDAYFFRLGKYRKELIKLIPKYIIPASRANEIISRLKSEELRDLDVTRKGLDWGIDAPVGEGFKIYVWFDALINYLTGADGNWPADVHVIGKGINWFHSVIWPAMLISAGEKLPKKLLVHGYVNLKGQKMSKSLGNVIDPMDLIDRYGAESVRYSLLRCSVFEDTDYSEEILIQRNNNELADKFGNLVRRIAGLAEKYGLEKSENNLLKKLKFKDISEKMDGFEFDKALNLIFSFIDSCNEYVQEKKPWETHDKKVLYELADSVKAIAILLWPFIPSACDKIAEQFNFKIKGLDEIKKPLKAGKIKKGEILFNKIE